MDTPILRGYQLYHNFIRPHEGLNGQTPSERAGIQIEGENKWLTIIQNACHAPNLNSEKKSGDAPKNYQSPAKKGLNRKSQSSAKECKKCNRW